MNSSEEKPSISLIIPHYGGKELLAKNLPRDIEAQQNPNNCIQEIIVVDDGSPDDSASFVKKNFPSVRLIRHKVNRGFSAAVNTGVRMSKGNYIVLLNNDVFPEKNFLENVLPFMKKDPSIFAISFHESGYGWSKGDFNDGFIVYLPGTEDRVPHHTFFVNAGGAIYRKNIWMDLGGMDESLFSPAYWEDVDISYRALKRGYRLFWHPDARVSPNLSATVNRFLKNKFSKIQERNQLLFIWKNLVSPQLFRKHLAGLLKRIMTHPGYLAIVFMAAKKLRIVLRERKKENKEGVVSDEAIFARFKT